MTMTAWVPAHCTEWWTDKTIAWNVRVPNCLLKLFRVKNPSLYSEPLLEGSYPRSSPESPWVKALANLERDCSSGKWGRAPRVALSAVASQPHFPFRETTMPQSLTRGLSFTIIWQWILILLISSSKYLLPIYNNILRYQDLLHSNQTGRGLIFFRSAFGMSGVCGVRMVRVIGIFRPTLVGPTFTRNHHHTWSSAD